VPGFRETWTPIPVPSHMDCEILGTSLCLWEAVSFSVKWKNVIFHRTIEKFKGTNRNKMPNKVN
jgi:hypothetical protein